MDPLIPKDPSLSLPPSKRTSPGTQMPRCWGSFYSSLEPCPSPQRHGRKRLSSPQSLFRNDVVLPGWRQEPALRCRPLWDAQGGGCWRKGREEGKKAVKGEGATCQPEAEIARAQEAFRPFFHFHMCSRSAVSNTGLLRATASAHMPFQILHSVS